MYAFMPKYHWLPFFVWCISGSRSPLLFFVELGAAMMPYDGRFYLRVGPYYWSTAEYRFRVNIVDAQNQIEAEDNNSLGQEIGRAHV
jgi:hypothetical protein